MGNFQEILMKVIEIMTMVINIWGVLIISIAFIKKIYDTIFKYKFDMKKVFLDTNLNRALANGLEVLLVGEILGTIVAYNLENLIHIGILVAIRVFISFDLSMEYGHKEGEITKEK